MLENLLHLQMSPDLAMHLVRGLWWLLALVWIAMAFAIKKVKRTETSLERVLHLAPLFFAFWLLFGRVQLFPWFFLPLLPNRPLFWWLGVVITALGMAISIWARLSLGTNWSGTVTLKDDHELIRKGLYRRIRHPIYTGILVGVIGTGMIHGQLRDLLCFAILYVTFYFKAKREESFLYQEFGPGFTEHQSHTGMFWPKLS
jgi:protein-S-isoprenylcysteine O-methyltransferase Ste14